MDRAKGRPVFLLSILLYLLIAFEILFMILPFAVYFYSVYGPVLGFLSKDPILSWSTDFFLPHLVFTKDPVVLVLLSMQFLFVVGLLMFFFAAVPLYYAKIFRKSIQMKWLYSCVRHPQYLALAIAGFGLLFYWPRFIILFFYVNMLFVYYFLARNEEWRMITKFGRPYEEYMERTPMFLPGEPGGKLFRLLFGRIRHRWAALLLLYLLCVSGSVIAAMGIRSYTEGRIQKHRADSIVAVPVFPRAEGELAALMKNVLSDPRVKEALPPDANLAYVMPADFFLMSVVTDEPRRFSPDVVNYPETVQWSRKKFHGSPATFFRIYYYYTKTVWTGRHGEAEAERIVFVRATRRGIAVPPEAALGIGLEREPLLLVDIGAKKGDIFFVKKLSGLHKWGRAPMPAF